MKALLLALVMTVTASAAHAIYDPSWERPILKSKMRVLEARLGFQGVEQAGIVLTKRDGVEKPTGINISFKHPESKEFIKQKLVIKDISVDECGSVNYHAGLAQEESENPRHVGARFSVTLSDHRTRKCKDRRFGTWEAHVRQGYGWCGTFDASMSLAGEPEPVITIQSIGR